MAKRIFSTILLWTIIGSLLYIFGAPAAVWMITLLSAATQIEFYGLLERMGHRPFKRFGTALGAIMILATYYANHFANSHVEGIQSGIIAVTIVACCLRILNERKVDERIEALGSTLIGLVYIPFMLTFAIRMLQLGSNENEGLMLVLWLIVTAKFCDVGALLVGRAFGRHPMSPLTSPKKTWEGAIGGVLVSVGLGFALTYFAQDYFPDFMTPFWGAVLAAPIAIVGIVSDLVESMIKREAHQKDSGSFIPGIGGAFDLSDSIILAAPTAFLLFELLLIL